MSAPPTSNDSHDPAGTDAALDDSDRATTQARKRWARGPARPQYLQSADVDNMLHIVIALMSEVSSIRDRLDTHELLAAAGVVATADAVEAHPLTAEQRTLREARRQAMLKRTLRVLTDHTESAGSHLSGRIGAKDPLDAADVEASA